MSGAGDTIVVLAALAGGLLVVAAREALLATPSLAAWLGATVEPLRRAGDEGYVPSERERRRLAMLGAGAAAVSALVAFGPGPAALAAPFGPVVAGSALAARRARYRRAFERGLPEVATALADGLAGGRSVRAALQSATASLEGAPAAEMARVRADLDLGCSTAESLAALRARLGSRRVDSLAAALLSEQLAGGDLTGLLRRFAVATAAGERVAADARSATAQARFTGMLVVAMPTGAALFAELIEPGFVAGLFAQPAAVALLVAAAGLQVAGFVAIGRLSRVAEG